MKGLRIAILAVLTVVLCVAVSVWLTSKDYSVAECYVLPEMEDVEAVYKYVSGEMEEIPEGARYDMDGDGYVTAKDVRWLVEAMNGQRSMDSMPGAVPVKVRICVKTDGAAQVVYITGTNQWGREFESYVEI